MANRPYDQPSGTARVYRFNDWVAVTLPFMDRTAYLSASEAMALSIALKNAAFDVTDQKSFSNSTLSEETIGIGT